MDAVTAAQKHSGFAKIGQEGLVINVVELLLIYCIFYFFNYFDVFQNV